ncbi:MAG: GLPGLI family protein [Flavobacteriaceae bacterium]|nr:GLPGLI family protein [Flavobacteriaceae bacterium]
MNKYLYVILISFFLHGLVNAQQLKVEYKLNIFPHTYISYFDLVIDDSHSKWVYKGYEELGEDEESTIQAPSSRQIQFYSSADAIYYEERLLGRFMKVQDQAVGNWQLLVEYDTINGLSCRYATTNFRGRDYRACYSTEIPISQGPWKFKGLPGLIIQIKSTDDFVEYTLNSLSASDEENIEKELKNFQKEEFRSFAEFEKVFINAYDKYIDYLRSNKDPESLGSFYKIGQIEIIYPELQTEQGIEY